MIILDEPTNHLDIESRDALVEALTEYGGAVILVSHDPHLVELVADRLWLVKDGRVRPFDDDMDAYRRLLLVRARTARRCGRARRSRRPRPAPPRAEVAPLRAEVAKCEARVAKLEEMRAAIDGAAGQPAALLARRHRGGRRGCRRSAPRSRTGWRAPRRCGWRRSSGWRRRGARLMLELLVPAFVTLFVIIDPIGLAPLFVALTHGMTPEERDAGRAAGARSSPSCCSRSSGCSASALLTAIGISHAGLPHLGRAAAVPDRARHAVRAAHRPARAPGGRERRPIRRSFRWRCR